MILGHPKTIVTCSTTHKEHTATWNFVQAQSEAKLLRKTLFGHFRVIDLASEVTGWARTWSCYTNLFVSWRATHLFCFFRVALAQSGGKRYSLFPTGIGKMRLIYRGFLCGGPIGGIHEVIILSRGYYCFAIWCCFYTKDHVNRK